MVRKKNKSLLKDKRLKYGVLLIGVLVILLFSSTLFFTAFGAYDLTADDVTVGADGSISEAAVLEFYILDYRNLPYDISDPPAPAELENSVCSLVCVENNEAVGGGTLHKTARWQRGFMDDPAYYLVTFYYVIDTSGVYMGSHKYVVSMSGDLEGLTYEFNIAGDITSPLYPDDDDDDESVPPGEPEFIQQPESSVSVLTNETNDLVWIVADDNPSNYSFYQNGVLVDSGVVPLDEFTYTATLEQLDAGIYEYKFVYDDVDDNRITDIVTVTSTNAEETADWLQWIYDNPLIAIAIVVVAMAVLGGGASKRGG